MPKSTKNCTFRHNVGSWQKDLVGKSSRISRRSVRQQPFDLEERQVR